MRKKRTFMKMVTMGLVMAIIMLSIPGKIEAYTGKHGVRVIVEKIDGEYEDGELLRIDEQKIQLIVHSVEGRTIPITEINRIMVKKKSKFLTGVLVGLGASLLAGGIIGGKLEREGVGFGAGMVVYGGMFSLPACAVFGGLFAMGSSGYQEYKFDGKNPEKNKTIIGKLKAKSLAEKGIEPRLKEYIPQAHTSYSQQVGKFHFSFSYGVLHSRANSQFKHFLGNARLVNPIVIFNEDGSTVQEVITTLGDSYFYDSNYFRIQPKNYRFEYSINSRIAVGLSLANLQGVETEITWNIPSDFYFIYNNTRAKIQGNAYFLTASYMPLPNIAFTKSVLKVGMGVGISKVNILFDQSNWRGLTLTQAANISPAFTLFGEWNGYLNRNLSLGVGVDYRWIPVKSPTFRFQSQMIANARDYDDPYSPKLEYLMEIPQGHFNIGEFGYHIQIGIHF